MSNPTHTDTNTPITDEQLLGLFDAKDAGDTFEHALAALLLHALSPEDKAVVHELWMTHDMLSTLGNDVVPPHALRQRMAQDVTALASAGYTDRRSTDRFIHFINLVTMQINWKFAAPVAVVVIALVATIGMSGKTVPTDMAVSTSEMESARAADTSGRAMMMMAAKNTVEPSGNVDDLSAVLVEEADQDLTFSADAEEDMTYVTSDSASINGYTTAYDETTL